MRHVLAVSLLVGANRWGRGLRKQLRGGIHPPDRRRATRTSTSTSRTSSLLALITNGFNLLQVEPVYQSIIQGAIILTAVAIDSLSRRAT